MTVMAFLGGLRICKNSDSWLLGSTDGKGAGGAEKGWCGERIRTQVCPHWHNPASRDEKWRLTKQLSKGGVAIGFPERNNANLLITQPVLKDVCMQTT